MAKRMAEQMELFEPVERGFQSGGDVAIAEMSAKEKILQKMREKTNKRLSRNEQYAIDRRKQMESMLTEADRKKQERSRQFAVMTEMLETGAIAKFTESQKADFMKLYNMMRQTQGMAEGGLLDEGGMIDEESGNDVPPGSLRSEVRDDIPAQLSEGEFVFPADVVRYIGLEKLMMMRQEAKQGLAQMEAMGQMGNSEQAVMPDNLPFDMYDLDIEDDGVYNMQSGGYVPPTQQPGVVDPITGTVKMPTTPRPPVVPASASVDAGYTKYVAPPPPTTTPSTSSLFYTTAEDTTNLPGFEDLLGKDLGEYDEFRTYINDAGQTMQIPFKDGQPLYPIPEGFYPKPDEPDMTDIPEEPTLVDSTLMLENDRDEGFDGGDFGGPGESRSSAEDAVMGMISKAHGFNVHTMQQEQLTPFEMLSQPLGVVRGLIQEYQINKEIDAMIDSIATGTTTRDNIMDAVKEMAQEIEDGIRDPETGEIDTDKSFESKFGKSQMDYKDYYGEEMESTEGPKEGQTPSDVDQQGHPGLSGSPSDKGTTPEGPSFNDSSLGKGSGSGDSSDGGDYGGGQASRGA
jgi:hypothetical protein